MIDIVPGGTRPLAGRPHAPPERSGRRWSCGPSRPGPRHCRARTHPGARLLAHGGHRAVGRRVLGRRPACAGRATFTDYRHMIIYGQRTADDRIAFGGRGAPYHFGSAVRPSFDGTPAVHRLLRRTLIELFPALCARPASPTPGAARWASPATGTPRSASIAAGASPGPGGMWVTASPRPIWPAGRWPISSPGADTELTALPWVNHRSRRLGARAAALAGRQRRALDHEAGRPHRGAQGPAQPPGHPHGALPGAVIGADVGRAPICPFCGVTALPSESDSWADSEFVCENPDCEAFGEPIAS